MKIELFQLVIAAGILLLANVTSVHWIQWKFNSSRADTTVSDNEGEGGDNSDGMPLSARALPFPKDKHQFKKIAFIVKADVPLNRFLTR